MGKFADWILDEIAANPNNIFEKYPALRQHFHNFNGQEQSKIRMFAMRNPSPVQLLNYIKQLQTQRASVNNQARQNAPQPQQYGQIPNMMRRDMWNQ